MRIFDCEYSYEYEYIGYSCPALITRRCTKNRKHCGRAKILHISSLVRNHMTNHAERSTEAFKLLTGVVPLHTPSASPKNTSNKYLHHHTNSIIPLFLIIMAESVASENIKTPLSGASDLSLRANSAASSIIIIISRMVMWVMKNTLQSTEPKIT